MGEYFVFVTMYPLPGTYAATGVLYDTRTSVPLFSRSSLAFVLAMRLRFMSLLPLLDDRSVLVFGVRVDTEHVEHHEYSVHGKVNRLPIHFEQYF